jgi:hypothetical protein
MLRAISFVLSTCVLFVVLFFVVASLLGLDAAATILLSLALAGGIGWAIARPSPLAVVGVVSFLGVVGAIVFVLLLGVTETGIILL